MTRKPVKKLSETVANQIAAGEVVERPASVVKELMENSIDAGSTKIEVEILGGGAKLVAVHDNGSGMSREDAINALERQATSKIASVHDIEKITTLGFRGEAIPSIASVSRFSLKTRIPESDAGTELHVTGGAFDGASEIGMPVGTSIEVRDLFFNVPARRKFMRAVATELSRIKTLFLITALANPEKGFILKSENREIYRLPENDTLSDRIIALLGENLADALLPVDYEANSVKVSGYVALPTVMRQTSQEQYVFINGRPATAPAIQYAIREAYPENKNSQKPIVVLFINLPPEDVDVNVHPTKREVRFRKSPILVSAVITAITQALGQADDIVTQTDDAANFPPSDGFHMPEMNPLRPLPTPQAPSPRQTVLPISNYPAPKFPPVSPSQNQDVATTPEIKMPEIPPPQTFSINNPSILWNWFRVADILEHGFFLIITDAGYVTIDSKAVTERIVYERLAKPLENEEIKSQQLLIPETTQLPPNDADRVRRYLPELQAMGFGVSDFGNDTFIIDAMPAVIAELSPRAFLVRIAEDLANTGGKKQMENWKREIVARAAAQAAASSKNNISKAQAEVLTKEISEAAMPYITPRGRPTMLFVSYRDLARRFQRI